MTIVTTHSERRNSNEVSCGKYVLAACEKAIITFAETAAKSELIFIEITIVDADGGFNARIRNTSIEKLQEFDLEVRKDLGAGIFSSIRLITTQVQIVQASENYIPVVIRWYYENEFLSNSDMQYQPVNCVSFVPKPFAWAPEPEKKAVPKKPSKPLEKDLEAELLLWMHSKGIQSDSQIQTSKHRMDLWIPGKCFLELKKGKVNGDDVCQAIDYCAEYKLPIVLVGNHIGDMASRGIEAFNKAVDGDMIAFVQWSAVRIYLKGLMNLQ